MKQTYEQQLAKQKEYNREKARQSFGQRQADKQTVLDSVKAFGVYVREKWANDPTQRVIPPITMSAEEEYSKSYQAAYYAKNRDKLLHKQRHKRGLQKAANDA